MFNLHSFQREQLTAAKDRIIRITSSPPPPGLEGKVNEMDSRWQQTEERSVQSTCTLFADEVSSRKDAKVSSRKDAVEKLEELVRKFEIETKVL